VIRRRWRGLLIVLAVMAVSAWGVRAAVGGDSSVGWVDATVRDLVVGLDVEGTLASRDSSLITPPPLPDVYDFNISFMAPEGSTVETGRPLLGFDTSELERQLLEQENQLEQALKNIEKLDVDLDQQMLQLQLQLAEAQAGRGKAELAADVPEDLRSENEAEIARLDLRLAQREVQSLTERIDAARRAGAAERSALVALRDRASSRVTKLQSSIKQMMVVAPRPGTVIYYTNWRGEKKKVGDSVWRQERVIELPDLQSMLARGEVDEADAGRIEVGQPVTLRLDAHPDTEFHGRLESIWRTVQRKRGTRNPIKVVRIEVSLDETDTERMRPGMRFRGTIEARRMESVLTVPTYAVFPTDVGPVVYRRTLLGHERVPVTLGARNATLVEVLDGLSPGDTIADTAPGS
jgi:multidrug efflux pump subunit AcrA (membrane-fusion protein)